MLGQNQDYKENLSTATAVPWPTPRERPPLSHSATHPLHPCLNPHHWPEEFQPTGSRHNATQQSEFQEAFVRQNLLKFLAFNTSNACLGNTVMAHCVKDRKSRHFLNVYRQPALESMQASRDLPIGTVSLSSFYILIIFINFCLEMYISTCHFLL